MAVSIQNSSIEFLATGAQDEIFLISLDYANRPGEAIAVNLNDVLISRTDYDVVANPEGATPPNITGYFVRFKRVLTLNDRVRITRVTHRTQLFDYVPGLNLSSFDIINSLDKLTRITQEAVAIAVAAGISDTSEWALIGNIDRIPNAKLANVTDYIADWAETGNIDPIPVEKLPNLEETVYLWAHFGNLDNIPETKLQLTKNFIHEWARTDLNIQIPYDKLGFAPEGMAAASAVLTSEDRLKLASIAVQKTTGVTVSPITGLSSILPRNDHTATTLPNGDVFILFGYSPTASISNLSDGYRVSFNGNAATVNPVIFTGDVISGRDDHTATLLPDGDVFIFGGIDGSAELNDGYRISFNGNTATVNTVTGLAGMPVIQRHTATLLPDESIFIFGLIDAGSNISRLITLVGNAATVSLVTLTGDTISPRLDHTATILPGGDVFIFGGTNNSAIFDDGFRVSFNGNTATASTVSGLDVISGRWDHQASPLPDGDIFLFGGNIGSSLNDSYIIRISVNTALVNTATGFINITARDDHTINTFPNGDVFIFGGETGSTSLNDGYRVSFSGERTLRAVIPDDTWVLPAAAVKLALLLNRDTNIITDVQLASLNTVPTIRNKLNTIQRGARVNVQSSWIETDDTRDAFIRDKPDPSEFGINISGGEDITNTQKFVLEDNGRVRLYGFRIAGGTNIFGYALVGSSPVTAEVAGGQLANAPASISAIYYDIRQGGRWHFRVATGTKQLKDIEIEGVLYPLRRTSTNVPRGRSWGAHAFIDIYTTGTGPLIFNSGSENIKVRHIDDTYYIGKAEAYVTDRVDRVKEFILRDVNNRVNHDNATIASILRRLDLLDPKTLTTQERNTIALLRQYAITVSGTKRLRTGITIEEELYGTYTHNDASTVLNRNGRSPVPAISNDQVIGEIRRYSNTTGSALLGAFEIDSINPDARNFLFGMNYVHSNATVVHTNLISLPSRPILHVDGATGKLQLIHNLVGASDATHTITTTHLIVNARTMKDEFGIGGNLATTVTGRHNISVAISNTFGASGFGPVSNFVISNLNTDANTGWLQFATLTYSRTNPQRIANFQYRYTLSSKALHFRTLDARTGDQFTIRATYNETQTQTLPTTYTNKTDLVDITSGDAVKIVGRVDTVNNKIYVSVNGGALVSTDTENLTAGDITFGENRHDLFQSPVIAELTSAFNNDDIQAICSGYPVHNNEPTSLKIAVGQYQALDIPRKENTIRDVSLVGNLLTITKDDNSTQVLTLPSGSGTVASDLVTVRAASGSSTRSVTLPTNYTNYDFVHISYTELTKLISFTVDTKELTKGSNRFLYSDTNILNWTFSSRVLSVVNSDNRFGITGVYLANSGATGPAGQNGRNGTNGTNGAAGADGTDGVDGTNGTDGVDGTNGTNGSRGPRGFPGSGSTLSEDDRLKLASVAIEKHTESSGGVLGTPTVVSVSDLSSIPIRKAHTTTLLPNGDAVVFGGSTSVGVSNVVSNAGYRVSFSGNTATVNTLTFPGQTVTIREDHVASLLQDGRIFVHGGTSYVNNNVGTTVIVGTGFLMTLTGNSAAVARVTFTGAAISPRVNHTANTLSNGTVFMYGGRTTSGRTSSSFILTFTGNTCNVVATTGSTMNTRSSHTATPLANGDLFIWGGFNGSVFENTGYRVSISGIAVTSPLVTGLSSIPIRREHASARLPDDSVLIVYGATHSLATNIYRIVFTGTAAVAALITTLSAIPFRNAATLNRLNDGRLFLFGGLNSTNTRTNNGYLTTFTIVGQITTVITDSITPDDTWVLPIPPIPTDAQIKEAVFRNTDTNNYNNAAVAKLASIFTGAQANVNPNWLEEDPTHDAYIQNKLPPLTNAQIKTQYEDNFDTNVFNNSFLTKLQGIQGGARVNVQSDWNATAGDAFIQNKPTVTANDHYLDLGINDLNSLNSGLHTGATKFLSQNNIPLILRFASFNSSNLPAGSSYTSATGLLILPAGIWEIVSSVNAVVDVPRAGTRKVTVSLCLYYGDTKRDGQAIHEQNTGWTNATYDRLSGLINLKSLIRTDGRTAISVRVEINTQVAAGNTVTIRGAHLKGVQQLVGAI